MQSLALRLPSTFKTALALASDWGQIFAAATLAQWIAHPAAYVASVIWIASRQHALLVLLHEGAHGHLFANKKWNDRISNWLTGWPLGIETERYRQHHWLHHQFTNTEKDPDWARKMAKVQWHFPKTKRKFWSDFSPYLGGMGALEMAGAALLIGKPYSWKKRLLYIALVLAPFVATQSLALIFFYWLVPWATALPLLMKVRSIVEHLGLPNENELNGSRNIIASPIEAFFFGPHNNALHLIHHLFPHVPWHNLKNMRENLLKNEAYAEWAHENKSYFLPSEKPVYRDLTHSSWRNNDRNERKTA